VVWNWKKRFPQLDDREIDSGLGREQRFLPDSSLKRALIFYRDEPNDFCRQNGEDGDRQDGPNQNASLNAAVALVHQYTPI
jgi:hypothetical protein